MEHLTVSKRCARQPDGSTGPGRVSPQKAQPVLSSHSRNQKDGCGREYQEGARLVATGALLSPQKQLDAIVPREVLGPVLKGEHPETRGSLCSPLARSLPATPSHYTDR